MKPFERKVALMRAGKTMSSIAEECGVSVTTVSQVVAGRRMSRRVREAVAVAIELPVGEVFPTDRLEGAAA